MAENILMASGPTVSAVRPGFGSIVTYGFVGISVAVLFYVLVKYIRLRRSRNYGSLKTKVEESSLADDGDSNDDEEEDLVTISKDVTRKIISCKKCGEIHIVRRYNY